MILNLLNILWFIVGFVGLLFWIDYLDKGIKIKLIKSLFVVLGLLAFVFITILLEKFEVLSKKVNIVFFILGGICSIVIQFKDRDITPLFFSIFIFFPVVIIVAPYLYYLSPHDWWYWILGLVLFVFLYWIFEYDISKRITIISYTLLFIGIILFYFDNIETYLKLIEKPTFQLTFSLLFKYFPMIVFMWILFYQIGENKKSNVKIKELEQEIKKLIAKSENRN